MLKFCLPLRPGVRMKSYAGFQRDMQRPELVVGSIIPGAARQNYTYTCNGL